MFLKGTRHIGAGLAALTVLTLGSTTTPAADDRRHGFLNADFGFTTKQTCARSLPQPPGTVSIDPDTRKLNVNAQIVDMSGSGVMTFTRDGDFRLVGVAAEFQKDQLVAGQTPIRDGFLPDCHGTYTLGPDNKLKVHFHCHIDVPSQGIGIEAGPVLAEGFVADGGRSATLNLLQNVQTLTVSFPNGRQAEFQRVCLQSFTLQKQ